MLKEGQKVAVKESLPFGTEVYIEEAKDSFYIPIEAEIFKGKIVTISKLCAWRKAHDGTPIYYYRIEEDGGSFGWLEEWFTPQNLKDICVIQLRDGRFIIIPRSNLVDVDFSSDYELLADEVQSNCTIFEFRERKAKK